jgi:hypothetical protein
VDTPKIAKHHVVIGLFAIDHELNRTLLGLNMCAFLSAFVAIHWIARVFFSRRDKADV